jgi:RHS repeat-associated protein
LQTTSTPVIVTVNGGVATLYFVHVDHLNTPRLVADAAGTTVWKWDQQEPFGNNIPDENPSGLGTFDLPLRLPGQYFDKETNLHYNFFRDYDPSIGRYGESDPIGLEGGLNTYAYVKSNPLADVDPLGLVNWKGAFGGGSGVAGVGGGVFGFSLTSECKCGRRVTITGFASGLAAGFGAKGGASGSPSEFYDYLDCPDPGIANGLFTMASAGLIIGVGPGYSRIQLGGLRSYFNLGDINYGFDVSVGLYMGSSAVLKATVECC